jgi:hypothetical protein
MKQKQIIKIVYGHIRQVYNAETQEFIMQEFVRDSDTFYYNENGVDIEPVRLQCAPFTLTQEPFPEPPDATPEELILYAEEQAYLILKHLEDEGSGILEAIELKHRIEEEYADDPKLLKAIFETLDEWKVKY